MALLCKDCAGSLFFDPQTQKLICKICGHSFAPEEIENPIDSSLRHLKATITTPKAMRQKHITTMRLTAFLP